MNGRAPAPWNTRLRSVLKLWHQSSRSWFPPLLYLVISLVVAFGVVAVIVWSLGINVVGFFHDMFAYPLTTSSGLSTLFRRIPSILLSGLTLAFAFRIGFWNVNSPGQLMVGMIAGAWVAVYITGLPAALHIPLTLLAGFAAGALVGLGVAYAKYRYGVNEVLLCLLMNFICQYGVIALLYGPMQGRALLPYTAPIAESAVLPSLFGRVHVGLILAIMIVVGAIVLVRYTRFGYMMTVVGKSVETARASGIDVMRVGLVTVSVSAGFSGLAGVMEVTGVYHYGFDTIVQGTGFYGMVCAFIAFGRLGFLIPAAILTSLVLATGELVKTYSEALPAQTPLMLLGLIAFTLIVTVAIAGRFVRDDTA